MCSGLQQSECPQILFPGNTGSPLNIGTDKVSVSKVPCQGKHLFVPYLITSAFDIRQEKHLRSRLFLFSVFTAQVAPQREQIALFSSTSLLYQASLLGGETAARVAEQ